jgi:pimeloyl-ACP methyl ester carboxylesterase
MTEIGRYITVHAGGLDFEVLEAGVGDRLALCLHGFPENAYSWRNQIPLLVSLGYRVWAPNQRGYGRSSKPPKIPDYDVSHLMEDVTALIDASGAKSVTLLAHDWGGAVAWCYAMRPARPIERLAILNVPHPALFARALRGWKQKARSWYMGFFQIPKLPEFLLGRNHAFAIGEIFRKSATDKTRFTPDVLAVYRDSASLPGALTGMLNWYRAAPTGLRAQMRLGMPMIEIPTIVIWGEADSALGKETTYGLDRYVKNLSLHYLPGVSHWVQQDAPEQVNELLEPFLRVPEAVSEEMAR